MNKLAYVIRHIHFENAGILEPLLIERGFTLEYIEAPLADFKQYDVAKADLIIVCGAPIGAYDEKIYPFLTDEIKFIKDRIDSKKPLLGICLGAQLISRIMGGHVGPMSHGKKEIPEGAVRLAETDLCPNQAFSMGTQILGLQFHLEADPTVIESWLVGHCAELSNAGIDIIKIRKTAKDLSSALPTAGRKAITAWLESNNL